MKHINFFLGAQSGGFWLGAKKFMLKSLCVFFRPFVEGSKNREGANREKLTVKKIINNEMFFFSPFLSLINREKSA